MKRFFASTAAATTLAFAAVATVFAGCGNYSNEDLEFMSAIPQREDLTVAVPAQTGALSVAAADGWRSTLNVTTTFNRTADAFLSLIEKVRSYYPTTRDANTRIWGPFPADRNPGWQIEFRMTKSPDPAVAQFTYEMVMIPPAGVSLILGGAETQIINGSFDALGGVRIGSGHFGLTLVEARAAGVSFMGLERLQTLTIDYATRDWPHQVRMALVNDTPLDPTVDVASAMYTYERAQNNDGVMTFTIPVGPDTFQATSHWRGTGEGRQDRSVIAGPDQGVSVKECWNNSFEVTYRSPNWVMGGSPEVGMAEACIPLP